MDEKRANGGARAALLLALAALLGCSGEEGSGGAAGGAAGGAGAGGRTGSGGAGAQSAEGGGGGTAGAGGGATTVSQTVGPEGGTVAGPNGVTLTIPPMALPNDTVITITPLGPLAGALGDAYDIGPEGTVFAEPVELTLPFDPASLGDTPLDALVIASQNPDASFTGTGWTLTDGAQGQATAFITHLSAWAVIPAPGASCFVNYPCLEQCAGTAVPDLCCDKLRSTCRMRNGVSFPKFVACYATCNGTGQVTNFGNSSCMRDCCTSHGWSVAPQGTCTKANATAGQAAQIVQCSRACFAQPDDATLCGTGLQPFPCAWNAGMTPDLGDDCDMTPGNGVASAVLSTDLGAAQDQVWGGTVHVLGGAFDPSGINLQITCESGMAGPTTMTGTWNGQNFTGTWTLGVDTGNFTISPAWL